MVWYSRVSFGQVSRHPIPCSKVSFGDKVDESERAHPLVGCSGCHDGEQRKGLKCCSVRMS